MAYTKHHQPRVYFNGVSVMIISRHAQMTVVKMIKFVQKLSDAGGLEIVLKNLLEGFCIKNLSGGIGVLTSSAPLELMPLDLSLRSNVCHHLCISSLFFI